MRLASCAAVGMDSLVGLVLLLSGWGLKRFLNEVYELKLRKHVRKLLGESVAPSVKPAIFLLAIWYEPLQTGAVVALSGDSLDRRSASEAKVTSIHLEAERLLELDQSGKPLVLLGIHNGLLVQGPLFFESLQQASDAVDVESRILDNSKKK